MTESMAIRTPLEEALEETRLDYPLADGFRSVKRLLKTEAFITQQVWAEPDADDIDKEQLKCTAESCMIDAQYQMAEMIVSAVGFMSLQDADDIEDSEELENLSGSSMLDPAFREFTTMICDMIPQGMASDILKVQSVIESLDQSLQKLQ